MTRPNQTDRGIGLAEVVVSFLVLFLAVVPALEVFVSAGRQARQAADHGLGLALQEKAAEELRLAAWENVHLARELEAAPHRLQKRSIVDAASPFFDTLEDIAPPLGRIGPEDGGIRKGTGPLYAEVSSHQLAGKLSARSLAHGGAVLDVGLTLSFRDFRGREGEAMQEVTLGRFGTARSLPLPVVDREKADEAIRILFYGRGRPETLLAAVARTGGDLQVVRDTGDVVLLVTSLGQSDDELDREADSLEARLGTSTDPLETCRLHVALGRIHERQAAAYLQAIAYLLAPAKRLASSFTYAAFGRARRRVDDILDTALEEDGDLTLLVPLMRAHMSWARRCYTRASDELVSRLMPARLRVRIFMKILELYKIELLTSSSPDLAPLQKMLSDFVARHEGRNRNFHDFALFELATCGDVGTLRAAYPAPERISACQELSVIAETVMTRFQEVP